MLSDSLVQILSILGTYLLLRLFDLSYNPNFLPMATILGIVLGVSGQILLVYDRVRTGARRTILLLSLLALLPANAVNLGLCWLVFRSVSWQFWVLYVPVQAVLQCAARFTETRALLDIGKDEYVGQKIRAAIVGAGVAGEMVAMEMTQDHSSCQYYPIFLVDDNPKKWNTRVCGVPVWGAVQDLPELCRRHEIRTILLAIPSATDEQRRRIMNFCSATGCEVREIPNFSQLLFQEKGIAAASRPINIEELLGRPVVTFDNAELDRMIRGKVCLVTGGGGSIGSELCRQIAKYGPARLIILDIYENNAYDIQQELWMEYGRTLPLDIIIASVRDYHKMNAVFAKYRPQVVFHAAAHKHVPLMETVPEEAVKNNVLGTFHTASLAEFYKAEIFVLISTDKAVNPTNVMGATKRCCEMVVQYMAQQAKYTRFTAVRFGNVLGSNGSVIPLFRRQIESGRPVTVTHKDIIRYFMTIPEAVSLVLQAGAMAAGGEIFVLDMGEPVRIVTLAENLIRQYGKEPYKDVPILFVGLRPGEKLYEELLMAEEGLRSTCHSKIFIGRQIDVQGDAFVRQLRRLKEAAMRDDSEATVQLLEELVPTFRHQTPDNQS
ncbi:MAG: polysaccharide biosynthesis protein [Clostridia bacterium]|nr:polysaccharide biosynthesis protein [Clostridia bacterium]